jgi:tetratricopeptide (TPR) repeat protein
MAVAASVPIARVASGEEAGKRDAAKHFQIGVSLYGEADYRAALVEFERAYSLAPNVAVLYNVGEAQYQLQEYAGALSTFERYLAQTSANDFRRGEVEQTLGILRSRVGHLSVVTDPTGADVTVDDQPAGRTPLAQTIAVSVGHRKVTLSMADRAPLTRYVDVAGGDTVVVNAALPPAAFAALEPPIGRTAQANEPLSPLRNEPTAPQGASVLQPIGWTATGVLAVGAVSFGLLALKSSSELVRTRATYPTTSATLDHEANITKTYSMLADALTAAAIVVGGVTLTSMLSSSSPSHRDSAVIRIGPTSARLYATF